MQRICIFIIRGKGRHWDNPDARQFRAAHSQDMIHRLVQHRHSAANGSRYAVERVRPLVDITSLVDMLNTEH